MAATRGGTYRVHDSSSVTPGSTSLISSSRQSRPKFLSITVVFLDDSQQTFEVEVSTKDFECFAKPSASARMLLRISCNYNY